MSERSTALAFFADELRRARGRAGLNQDQLADKISYSKSQVAMVETGRRMPSADFAARCDDALETDGLLARLSGLVSVEQAPEWFRPWLDLEREATALWSYQPNLIWGLLQTEGYARAVLGSGESLPADELDQRVATRLERQEILRSAKPSMVIAILDEEVLRRPVGGPKVMHDQLQHLADLADRVLVQVVPTATGMHPGLMGALVIATFDGMGEMAYLDTPLRGQVVESPSDVAVIKRRWEALRAEALPRSQSIDLIIREAEQWKP